MSFMQNIVTESWKSFNYRLPVEALFFSPAHSCNWPGRHRDLAAGGYPAGIISAVRVNSLWDNLGKIIALLGLSIPDSGWDWC
jgi:hypothetical protein